MTFHKRHSHSEQETLTLAAEFSEKLGAGDIVLLYGELGSGKTAFIRGMVHQLAPNAVVTSPTFTLANVYPSDPAIYHLDLYRIRATEDLVDLGLQDFFESEGIVIIEWGEKCEQMLPEKYYSVSISILGEFEREIEIQEHHHVSSRC